MMNKIIHSPYYLLLPLLLLFTHTSIMAQKKGQEKIKALKVAHITTELSLTPEEAQQFWPIYNAHHKTMQELRRQERSTVKSDMQVLGRLSEQEAKTLLNTLQDIRKQRFEAKQKLNEDLSKILSNKKIVLLARAEENFKRKLLKQYGDRTRMIDLRKQAIEERRKEKIDGL